MESEYIYEESEGLSFFDKEKESSFTALLELPPLQAIHLLHPQQTVWENYPLNRTPTLPANLGLLERASKFSVFAAVRESNADLGMVKQEPSDLDSKPSSHDPMVTSSNEQKSNKRKEIEKEKDSKKKIRRKRTGANVKNEDPEKLPYVHVRARRGQATDSHSLAERARREKINARMKLLQELVPGCNKITGTAMVLDEIISHVQTLQRQVEFLSMRLATVNPSIDFDIDSLLTAQAGSSMDSNYQSMVMPYPWPNGHVNMGRQLYPQLSHFDGLHVPEWGSEEKPNFITPENSLLSYVSSPNSASLHSNQLKKET